MLLVNSLSRETFVAGSSTPRASTTASLMAVKSIVRWGLRNARLETNPVAGISIDVKRKAGPRHLRLQRRRRSYDSAAGGPRNRPSAAVGPVALRISRCSLVGDLLVAF